MGGLGKSTLPLKRHLTWGRGLSSLAELATTCAVPQHRVHVALRERGGDVPVLKSGDSAGGLGVTWRLLEGEGTSLDRPSGSKIKRTASPGGCSLGTSSGRESPVRDWEPDLPGQQVSIQKEWERKGSHRKNVRGSGHPRRI